MADNGYNPCAACSHTHCCTHYTVNITGYDLWRIAQGFCLSPEEFLIFFTVKEPRPGTFKLDHSGQTCDIALDKAKTRAKEAPCVFWLSLPGGCGRCGIYPLRPLTCQVYPAFFRRGSVHIKPDLLCPPNAWNLAIMDLPLWREKLLRTQMEFDVYHLVVARWNAYVDSAPPQACFPVQGYCAYLMNVFTRLERVWQAVPEELWPAILSRWGEYADRQANPLTVEENEGISPPGWREFLRGIQEVVSSFLPPQSP
ncbi:MAG: YkgJ family cysteine cluster protein [Chloroflexota bacterium]